MDHAFYERCIALGISDPREGIYRLSEPAPAALIDQLHPYFDKAGLAMPEIRVSAHASIGAYAIPKHNGRKGFIVVGDQLAASDIARVVGAVGHEMGHLVHGIEGKLLKKDEYLMDRFAHFFAGSPNGLADHLAVAHAENALAVQHAIAADGSQEMAEVIEAVKTMTEITYGTPQERDANLRAPLQESEVAQFREAIARYNAQLSAEATPAARSFASRVRTLASAVAQRLR
jgi:hypothetical protein